MSKERTMNEVVHCRLISLEKILADTASLPPSNLPSWRRSFLGESVKVNGRGKGTTKREAGSPDHRLIINVQITHGLLIMCVTELSRRERNLGTIPTAALGTRYEMAREERGSFLRVSPTPASITLASHIPLMRLVKHFDRKPCAFRLFVYHLIRQMEAVFHKATNPTYQH